MDAPPIQYARTEDGVNIAYSEMGEGTPWIWLLSPNNGSLARLWEDPTAAAIANAVSARFRLVAVSPRGSGESDRNVEDLSLDARVQDIEAVAEAVTDGPFVLHAGMHVFAPAVRFATQHTDMIRLLVLLNPYARGSDVYESDSSILTGIRKLSKADYELAVRTAHGASGLGGEELAQAVSISMTSMSASDYQRFTRAQAPVDVAADLSRVACPTLIAAPRGGYVPEVLIREVAAGIRDSRLVALPSVQEGEAHGEALLGAALSMLGEPSKQAASGATAFRTLLFTDLESSTELTQSLGDDKAQEVLRGHNDAVRTALTEHGGEEVKHTGDGIFAAFGSAVSAVAASLQIQRELAGAEVRVRIGLNAGEPIAEDGDYFGSAVQLAARVCDRAEPGEVLVSNVVKELCAGKLFQFEDQGEATLKGFPEPVRLFVVGERA